MGIIRGRVNGSRSYLHTGPREINGPALWYQCKCGKWKDRETGEHVEVESITLEELLKRYTGCPDDKADRE